MKHTYNHTHVYVFTITSIHGTKMRAKKIDLAVFAMFHK